MRQRNMHIGIDLDNTIVCYDEVFRRLAAERFGGDDLASHAAKDRLRSMLRQAGREEDWTELQGEAYGPGMEAAIAFPGVREFFSLARLRGADVCVISHRSLVPYRGPKHDLHAAARSWLTNARLWCGSDAPPVYLETTKEAKLARIATEGCTHFVDDLPELLAEPAFPKTTAAILFDPHRRHEGAAFVRAASWSELSDLLFAK
jgi:hypothetical protein